MPTPSTLNSLNDAVAHAILVLERATDAVAWVTSGSTAVEAHHAATRAFPELTPADHRVIAAAALECEQSRKVGAA